MKEKMKLTGSRCRLEVENTNEVFVIQFFNNYEDCEFQFSLNNNDHKEDILKIILDLKEYIPETKKKQDLYKSTVILNEGFFITYHMKEDTFPFINLSVSRITKSTTKGEYDRIHKIITDMKITNKELKTFYKLLKKVYEEGDIENVS
jgi:hypothetical protein